MKSRIFVYFLGFGLAGLLAVSLLIFLPEIGVSRFDAQLYGTMIGMSISVLWFHFGTDILGIEETVFGGN